MLSKTAVSRTMCSHSHVHNDANYGAVCSQGRYCTIILETKLTLSVSKHIAAVIRKAN